MHTLINSRDSIRNSSFFSFKIPMFFINYYSFENILLKVIYGASINNYFKANIPPNLLISF